MLNNKNINKKYIADTQQINIFVGIGIILLTFIIGMIMVDDTENKKKSNIKKK